MNILFWGILFSATGFLLFSAISSFIEKELRAGIILLFTTILFPAISVIPLYLIPEPTQFKLLFILIITAITIFFFFPTRRGINTKPRSYGVRFHEADAILARRNLIPGTAKYDNYYRVHPEYRKGDDKARGNPGLLSEKSRYFDPVTFNAAEAGFIITDHLHTLEDFPVSGNKKSVDAKKITSFIRKWLRNSGAHSVGFTPLMDHQLYSHKGRGKRAGEKILNDLSHAIVFTVEMDYKMMKYAPAGPTVMESSEQYLQAGILATRLALLIKNLGYNATAHIDGNYEVICPVIAADAGLGVIGRMGLLITPQLGPRVRIAVVTTDLPLVYKQVKQQSYVIDFCNKCKKCVTVCPANAIPSGPRKEIGGSLRWRIDSESCYNFWTISGTDCGRCVISCPFSHPNNWFHSFIRWGIKNNLFFRRMAVKLDDIFYSRKPSIRELPDWLTFIKQK